MTKVFFLVLADLLSSKLLSLTLGIRTELQSLGVRPLCLIFSQSSLPTWYQSHPKSPSWNCAPSSKNLLLAGYCTVSLLLLICLCSDKDFSSLPTLSISLLCLEYAIYCYCYKHKPESISKKDISLNLAYYFMKCMFISNTSYSKMWIVPPFHFLKKCRVNCLPGVVFNPICML